MKKYENLFAVIALVSVVGFGCGYLGGSDPSAADNSNRSMTDRAIDTAVGRSNLGVPECDRILDAIELELNNPEDNFVLKAAKATALNRIKDGIRQKIEQNPNDKAGLEKTCREFKTQFDQYKSGEQQKQR